MLPVDLIAPHIEQMRGTQLISMRTRTRVRIAELLTEHWIAPRLSRYPLAAPTANSISESVSYLATGYLARGAAVVHDSETGDVALPGDLNAAINLALAAAWLNAEPCPGTILPKFWGALIRPVPTLLVRPRGVT